MSAPIAATALLDGLTGIGVRLVAGVPCSYFAAPLRLLERGWPDLPYVAAANEGSALAIAAGAHLGGGHAAVLAQNSGFGNLINPLTSLLLPYRIPTLVMMSLRGWPRPDAGEPQHRWMGTVIPDWLRSLDVPHWILGPDGPDVASVLAAAGAALDDRRTAFLLVARSTIEAAPRQPPAAPDARLPTRAAVVAALLAEVTDQHILSTTGYLSRELYNQDDRAGNFYMQGSMGHVAGLALGAALMAPRRRFVILDGDGALLMHAGVLATLGHHRPPNVTHVVFDNGGYESTGGQRTAAGHTDFAALATAHGYATASEVADIDQLRPALRQALAAPGPTLLVMRGRPAAVPGGRASEALPPAALAERFAHSLTGRTRLVDSGTPAGSPR
jgi:phosphonopyruvate decarboxylase